MNIRLEANRQLVQSLSYLVEKYPDMRFGQLLVFSNVIAQSVSGSQRDPSVYTFDPVHEESAVTLSRVQKLVAYTDISDSSTLRQAAHSVVKESIAAGVVNDYGQPKIGSTLGEAVHKLWKALTTGDRQ